eukprot:Tbor_TRINITY_DN6103_c1_g1::TRINITY_DN6103_c1_g1_i5::g.21719::m.21719
MDGHTLVTINGENVNEKIFFSFNRGEEKEYTVPINVTTSTHIRAYVEFNDMKSRTNEIIISDLYNYKVSRSECPKYVPCAVKLSDGAHQVTSSYVVLIESRSSDNLIKVLNSSKYAQVGGDMFTNLLKVSKVGIFMTPDIGNDYINIESKDSITVKMVAFPPSANDEDTQGILIDGSIEVSSLKVTP